MTSRHAESDTTLTPNFVLNASDEAKLLAVLSNLNSTEVRLCSLAAKDFINLINGENGAAVILKYAHLSNDFSELKSAWKLRHEKGSGIYYVFKVVYAVLNHPDGKYVKSGDRDRLVVSRRIDKLATFVFKEKMQDVYAEIKSKDGKRQSAALMLMGAVVRRGSGFAYEVAQVFDFKMPGFGKLAEVKRRKDSEKKVKSKTRKSYVWFAMSFLDVGKPGLLRWVLRQRDVYYSILRGLSDDDDDTIDYVLSTLRDRVLSPDSSLPTPLRSVLFGSNTLEQLINISGREGGGTTAELCHEVLIMVCTDPSNGLMPDLEARPNPLKGNRKRLMDLMKKLRATEINYHKTLVLSIVKGRPSLGSAYLDEFPYKVEDPASTNWSASALLAADLVSSASSSLSFSFLQSRQVITYDSPDVQSIMKCISPGPFSRSLINKGLLHSHFSVKHGTLRLLLEALKLLDRFLSAINYASRSSFKNRDSLTSLKQDILNEARLSLPDPQVILTLLSTIGSQSRDRSSCSKRAADTEILAKQNRRSTKKPKTHVLKEDMDIIVAGIVVTDSDDSTVEEEADEGADCTDSHRKEYSDLSERNWWVERCSTVVTTSKDEEIYFQSKLIEAVKFYFHIQPDALESSFDFFVNFLSNASSLPAYFLQSLMSLLVQYTAGSEGSKAASKTLPLMYKHLQTFTNMMVFSPVCDIRKNAYDMAQSALLSTGAFDNNLSEIHAWFLFLPGFCIDESLPENKEREVLHNLTSVVSSFLCDSISTVGNNLFKNWDLLRHQIYRIEDVKDMTLPTFSPLVPCIFQKCLRLLNSESRAFTYPGKMMIALYVCNTLKYILQTQVDAKLFAAWIDLALSEGLESASYSKNEFLNEWRPLRDLWNFSRSVSNFGAPKLLEPDQNDMHINSSFVSTLYEVKNIFGLGGTRELASSTESLLASAIGTSCDDILSNFPTTMEVLETLLGVPLSFLSSTFFSHPNLLVKVLQSWPDKFAPAFESFTYVLSEKKIRNLNCEVSGQPLLADGTLCNLHTDSRNSKAGAFGLFLELVPLHIVFPIFMSLDGSQLMDKFRMKDWLLYKVSKCSFHLLIPTLRMVLFWFDQFQHYFRTNPLDELVTLSEICFAVIEILLDQIWVAKKEHEHSTWLEVLLSEKILIEVSMSVFGHPSVRNSLELMLKSSEISRNQTQGDALRDFLFSGCDLNDVDASHSGVVKVDYVSLRILKKTSDKLLSICNGDLSVYEDDASTRSLSKKIDEINESLLIGLKNKIDACIKSSDLVQVMSTLHVFSALKQLIPPSELLGLAHWVLSRLSKKDLSSLKSRRSESHVVCFHITHEIFETLTSYWVSNSDIISTQQAYVVDHGFEVQLLDVYYKIVDMTTYVKLDIVDFCLFKAIKFISMLQGKLRHPILTLNVALSTAVARTPNELVSHCIQGITMTKARLLFLLTEVTPFHLSVFGDIFIGITNPCSVSKAQLLMLLPTALSYIRWSLLKFGKEHIGHLACILTQYFGVILKDIEDWNCYGPGFLSQEDYNDLEPISSKDLHYLCSNSLHGKCITLLKYCCALPVSSFIMKKRLELFDSICSFSPGQDQLLSCDISELRSLSNIHLTNYLTKAMAKTFLCEIILFPFSSQEQSSEQEDYGKGENDTFLTSSRLQFVNMVANSWCLLVSASASIFAKSGDDDSVTKSLLKQYEVFLLGKLVEAVERTREYFIQLHSIPFLEQFFKTSLRHRFEDSATLKILRTVLGLLSEGTYSSDYFIELLRSHSRFASAMHAGLVPSEHRQAGLFAGQVSNIVRDVVSSTEVIGKTDSVMPECLLRKLELVKILRLLFHLSCRKHGKGSEKHLDIDLRKFLGEMFFLLLSSYGATLSEVDLEIYSLINEIESVDGLDYGNISDMDYMWGSAAVMVKKNRELELSASHITNVEEAKEWRRTQFRENLLFDPKLLLITVMNFPHNRKASTTKFGFCESNVDRVHGFGMDNIIGYDPVFILRFSAHILSVGYVEPLEFTGLGLLPLAFVSISSPDEGIRMLGYEVLGRFQNALEKSQNRKDGIRLLLTCVQNGIEERETLQQIPSIIGIFAAEASTILLDKTNEHYSLIEEFLTSSPALKMKRIPLFDKFFWSSSLNFKNERMWILQMCYKGLHQKEDAYIYTKSSALENLLSYYSSPFSDDDSKILILQILVKAAKLHKTAEHLVKNCSLLPWLSHRISYFDTEMVGEKNTTLVTQLILVCKVVMEIGSSRSFAESLQKEHLEQLSEFSSHIYKLLLINGESLVRVHVDLVDSILQILTLTAKVSQKRNIYQPHFTLSFEGMFQIYKTISHKDSVRGSTAELGLEAILMSTPPVAITQMEQGKLSEFLLWVISTVATIDDIPNPQYSTCDPHLILKSEELKECSLTSKLLRWLSASVILANTSSLAVKGTLSNLISTDGGSLLSLLKSIQQEQNSVAKKSDSEVVMANIMVYLYHSLLRHSCRTAPSAIAALCILLFCKPVSDAGSISLNADDFEIHVAPLALKIRPPPEVNPKWRWTFYQPWEDRTSVPSDIEKLEESKASERLLGTILNVLQKKHCNHSMQ